LIFQCFFSTLNVSLRVFLPFTVTSKPTFSLSGLPPRLLKLCSPRWPMPLFIFLAECSVCSALWTMGFSNHSIPSPNFVQSPMVSRHGSITILLGGAVVQRPSPFSLIDPSRGSGLCPHRLCSQSVPESGYVHNAPLFKAQCGVQLLLAPLSDEVPPTVTSH